MCSCKSVKCTHFNKNKHADLLNVITLMNNHNFMSGKACQGIYTPKEHFHKQNAQCNYISIGDVRISFACQRPSAPQPGTRPSTASPLGC